MPDDNSAVQPEVCYSRNSELKSCLTQANTLSNSDFDSLNCNIILKFNFELEKENGFLTLSKGQNAANLLVT